MPNRMRPASSPPYPSVRRFVFSARNCEIKYPAEPQISTASKPAAFVSAAARAKPAMMTAISSSGSSRVSSPVSPDV